MTEQDIKWSYLDESQPFARLNQKKRLWRKYGHAIAIAIRSSSVRSSSFVRQFDEQLLQYSDLRFLGVGVLRCDVFADSYRSCPVYPLSAMWLAIRWRRAVWLLQLPKACCLMPAEQSTATRLSCCAVTRIGARLLLSTSTVVNRRQRSSPWNGVGGDGK